MRKDVDEEVERFVSLFSVASGSQNAQCCVEALTGKEARCNSSLLFILGVSLMT